MRPITVTVGPLATASANNICTSQTPAAAGQFALNGTLASASFVGTGSISGSVLTITAVTSGLLAVRQPVGGLGVAANTLVGGTTPITGSGGIGTYVVTPAQTLSSTTIYGVPVATLDTPRRVLITAVANETSRTFTVTGTDWGNTPITELVTGPNAAAVYTNLDFKTVTSVSINGAASGAITVGTTTVASSPWVRLDEFSVGQVGIQVTVTGTVTYSLQQTLQDPGSPFSPVAAYQVVWLNSADASAVNSNTTIQSNYTYAPLYAKATITSGTGSLTVTYSQYSSAPY